MKVALKFKEKETLQIGYARDEDIKALFELLGMVAKANGVVQKSAIEEINHFMDAQLTSTQRDYAIASFRAGKEAPNMPNSIMKRAFQLYGFQEQEDSDPWLKPLQVLDILLRVAFADGEYSNEEDYIIDSTRGTLGVHKRSFWILRDTLAERLGLSINREWKSFAPGSKERSQSNFNHRSSSYEEKQSGKIFKTKLSIAEAYKILQVNVAADIKDIKVSYRALVKKFHPDALKRDNAPEHVIKEAVKSFYNVQEAYELLVNLRQK